MIIALSIFLAAILILCIFQMCKIRKLSSRINQLESAILGNRTERKIPYESLELLNNLRRNLRHWSSSEDSPHLLTVKPVFIELLDNYISELLDSIPDLNHNDMLSPTIEPRPLYTSLYLINSVMFYPDGNNQEKWPIRFYCANREQADSIANLLASKGIDAHADEEVSVRHKGIAP